MAHEALCRCCVDTDHLQMVVNSWDVATVVGGLRILHQKLKSLPFEPFKVTFAAMFWPFQSIWNLLALELFATAGIWVISFEGLCGIDLAVQRSFQL